MPKLRTLSPIRYNGKRYDPPKTFECADDDAGPLVAAGAAEVVPEKKQEKKDDKK